VTAIHVILNVVLYLAAGFFGLKLLRRFGP
jgi:hypothetical protein